MSREQPLVGAVRSAFVVRGLRLRRGCSHYRYAFPVQGVFLDGLERYAIRKIGLSELERIQAKIGRGHTGYSFDTAYADDEVGLIVQGIAEATGRQPDEILQEFAEDLVPTLLDIYGFVIDSSWTFVDFLLRTESVIHKAVRLNAPSAKPPAIQARRIGSDTVAIAYRSERRLCAVAKGIIRGCATHYRTPVVIGEESCMLKGDPDCVLIVSPQT